MSKVLVVDSEKRPLNPIHSAQARQLLRNKKAAIYRRFPFTLILRNASKESAIQPLRLKIDPGSQVTGIALVNDTTGEVVNAFELKHRGFGIREALTSRRQLRRSRRNRKTRYRQPRFDNRTKPQGWLPPSLQSRIHNVRTWVNKLRRLAPIEAISQELVYFDMQLIRNSNIQGKEYQQGTLCGYETREYLLEKWGRQCAYCGVKDAPLQVEHIHPRAKGGSNSITNLTLSCVKCNTKKGTKDIKEFLKKDPARLEKILRQVKQPLADAAAVNATRWALLNVLKATGLPVETGSGGLTKFNRTNQELTKTHWLDAACVGRSTPKLLVKGIKPLLIQAFGHGTRQQCRTDKYGFPSRHCSRTKFHFGFQTGDIVSQRVGRVPRLEATGEPVRVKAVVLAGKKAGVHVGRIATRATGSFNISTKNGLIQSISYKYCKHVHKKDGYSYI